ITASLRRTGDLGEGRHGIAEVTICDNGIGIAPEELSLVFDRFYRAAGARARDPGGTGLGLPIARRIATQLGGSVTLSSVPGGGTSATFQSMCAVFRVSSADAQHSWSLYPVGRGLSEMKGVAIEIGRVLYKRMAAELGNVLRRSCGVVLHVSVSRRVRRLSITKISD
ncbi:MAG: ATP-binding protein, partial [Gemmatimonadales bacterium]